MIIYKDVISGDEICSDTFPIKEVDGVVYEIEDKRVPLRDEGANLGISFNEEADDEGGEKKDGGNDDRPRQLKHQYTLATAMGLLEMDNLSDSNLPYNHTKKDFKLHIKAYLKAVKDALQSKGASAEDIKDFEKRAIGYVGKLLPIVEDCNVYLGNSMDWDAMNVLLTFPQKKVEGSEETEEVPTWVIWKHGLVEEKV
ncbi:MAG: hypothetical protein M1825_002445 [Sarcosagium campestre]|nr:MAG: hypothetical protein M1825_002445 [Sarcosagium campestre]